ncbi:23S rRNA (guanosine(2251)-2'-O)-methyltransferase RlmB [Tissierella praeacuta]|uniref:23S rRNA (guanosine(2251)-2'-O)-methyltransferase RlmB n=1 Tax=Tissierella praeacuta TaxID=43131 RepID=UPI00289F1C39|nr:23S rRNA (guanosine(2251)-2'-O)-methyltransferase RlmB [Tissierella praeacuta]
MLEITSIRNPLVKEIKSLYRKKGRIKNNSFIIEGMKAIEEAIDNNYPIKNIIYTDQILKIKDGEAFFERIKKLNNIIYVPNNIFKDISDTENPQGVLGVAEIKYNEMREVKDKERPFLVFLDGVQDPGNMGTIIRTADAFNVDGIIITDGCVDPYNPKVVRATMGSIFRVPLYYVSDGIEELKSFKDINMSIYSTSLTESIPIYEVDFNEGVVLIIGNESNGVSEEIFSLSDKLIKIPMIGGAESLNAGVAASIIMYEVMKQRT